MRRFLFKIKLELIQLTQKLSKNSGLSDVKATGAATLPVKDGSTIGSGDYIVTVGLGLDGSRLQVGVHKF